MRTDETLKFLKKRGQEGVSSQELADKFNFAISGSACKIISRLRNEGHTIEQDKERGVYVLLSSETLPEQSPAIPAPDEGDSEIVAVEDSEDTGKKPVTDTEAVFFRVSGKKDKILEYLLRVGANGASPAELSKCSGVRLNNVCFHIHSLRKEGQKISLKEGKYIIRANRNNPLYEKGTENLPSSSDPIELETLLADKRLFRGINNIPQGTERTSYLDLLKKIIYYTRCALAMHDTNESLQTLTIGDGR